MTDDATVIRAVERACEFATRGIDDYYSDGVTDGICRAFNVTRALTDARPPTVTFTLNATSLTFRWDGAAEDWAEVPAEGEGSGGGGAR